MKIEKHENGYIASHKSLCFLFKTRNKAVDFMIKLRYLMSGKCNDSDRYIMNQEI